MTGRADATNFTVYHQVLNRGRWKGRALARTLLDLVVAALVPEGPVIIGVDDTIERRSARICVPDRRGSSKALVPRRRRPEQRLRPERSWLGCAPESGGRGDKSSNGARFLSPSSVPV